MKYFIVKICGNLVKKNDFLDNHKFDASLCLLKIRQRKHSVVKKVSWNNFSVFLPFVFVHYFKSLVTINKEITALAQIPHSNIHSLSYVCMQVYVVRYSFRLAQSRALVLFQIFLVFHLIDSQDVSGNFRGGNWGLGGQIDIRYQLIGSSQKQ